jgi:hypothetical protein
MGFWKPMVGPSAKICAAVAVLDEALKRVSPKHRQNTLLLNLSQKQQAELKQHCTYLATSALKIALEAFAVENLACLRVISQGSF